MKVRDLIAYLDQIDPDATVVHTSSDFTEEGNFIALDTIPLEAE